MKEEKKAPAKKAKDAPVKEEPPAPVEEEIVRVEDPVDETVIDPAELYE